MNDLNGDWYLGGVLPNWGTPSGMALNVKIVLLPLARPKH